jgi:glycerol-3-phosphate dehydrogenase
MAEAERMDRTALLDEVTRDGEGWDMILVGGGATGLGTALEAAARGYRTLRLEQRDFAKATSSRSTKLVHGGVRYLQQGNVSLVMEASKEHGRLLANAPHIARTLPFVVPVYEWWDGPFHGVGMTLYDMLAGKLGLGPSTILSREETIRRLPNVETKGLKIGVIYRDGQFDDARLAIDVAQSIAEAGGVPLNAVKVTAFKKRGRRITGVVARDVEKGEDLEFDGRVVVNATGIFSDVTRQMDDPAEEGLMAPSQGVRLVLDRSFLPGESAIMVPKTAEARCFSRCRGTAAPSSAPPTPRSRTSRSSRGRRRTRSRSCSSTPRSTSTATRRAMTCSACVAASALWCALRATRGRRPWRATRC